MLFATQNEAIPTELCQCGLISQLLKQMQQIKPLNTQPKSTVNYKTHPPFPPSRNLSDSWCKSNTEKIKSMYCLVRECHCRSKMFSLHPKQCLTYVSSIRD